MLGSKNLLRRSAWLGAAALIVLANAPASAAAAKAEGDASALTAEGALIDDNAIDLNTNECRAQLPGGAPNGTGTCGNGLDTNAGIDAFSQVARARNNGTSNAGASVAPIDFAQLATISLEDIVQNGLANLDTGTVLDPLITQLVAAAQPLLQALLPQLDQVIQQITGPLSQALPVSLETGAVEAAASATPTRAQGTSKVASLDLSIELGGQAILLPLTGENIADAPQNTQLLVEAPQILVDAVLDAVEDSLNTSIGGSLAPVAVLVPTIKEQVIDQLLNALEPTLLQPLSDALEPILIGTVNKQVDGDGDEIDNPGEPRDGFVNGNGAEMEVTALDLQLFNPPFPDAMHQSIQIARVHVGPNSAGTATPTPTPPDEDDDGGDDDDSDGDDGDGDDDEPKVVDSGINDGGDLGALAITGLLAASTLIGSAARQRLLLG